MRVDRDQILAFRLPAHNLTKRLPRGSVVKAIGVVGVRSTEGTLLPALHARVQGVTEAEIDDAVDSKTIVEILGPGRGITLVPARDVDVFTIGGLPSDEESLRVALKPFLRTFDPSEMRAQDALALARDVALDALSAGPLPWPELARVMTERLPDALTPQCRGRCPDPHIEDILFRLVAQSGAWCFVPGGDSILVRTDQWLGEAPDRKGRPEARAELVRRHLACHGPSTAADVAAWAGISNADARASIADLGDEATEVGVGGRRRGWIRASDAERLAAPRQPRGVRFLPRNDPYLQGRDRQTTLPDRAAQRSLWRTMSSPGAVLVDGEIVATWRAQKKGKRLQVTVRPFGAIGRAKRSAMEGEADALAAARGCGAAELVDDEP